MKVYVYSLLGLVGRLGNQFWQVAATLDRAARDHESRAALPSDWEYRSYVCLPDDWYAPPEPGDEIVDMVREPAGPYFQALEHIEQVSRYLPGLFGPSERGSERLRALHGPLLDQMQASHYTAVHVRRTDYLENPTRFPQLTPHYFRTAIKTIREEHDTRVLVFSDDVPWCRANAEEWFGGDVGFVEGHVRPIPPRERVSEPADILDLWLMSHCRSFVIANSTFSWWGAFLSSQEQVFYPDVWYGPDATGVENMWEAFPESWIQLPC